MSVDSVSPKVLDIGEVLSDTFAVIGRTFVLLANVAVLFIAMPAVIKIAGAVLTPVSPMFSFVSLIGSVATVVGMLVADAAMFMIAMQALHGQTVSTDDLFNAAGRKFWPLLGLTILFALGVGLGLVLLIVPGVILLLAWSVAMPALVLEDRGVFASLKRSAELTRGKRWSIFLLFFIVGLVSLVIELVLFAVFGGFRGLLTPQGNTTVVVLSSLISVITIPFGAVMNTALFDHLRGKAGYGAEAVAEVFA